MLSFSDGFKTRTSIWLSDLSCMRKGTVVTEQFSQAETSRTWWHQVYEVARFPNDTDKGVTWLNAVIKHVLITVALGSGIVEFDWNWFSSNDALSSAINRSRSTIQDPQLPTEKESSGGNFIWMSFQHRCHADTVFYETQTKIER